jgi:hypothetical protein
MNDITSVVAHALNLDPHVHGNHSAPHRRGGAWRRHMAIAAAGLAIVASVAGISDRAAAAEQNDLDRPYVGYVKKADLGKLKGEIAG